MMSDNTSVNTMPRKKISSLAKKLLGQLSKEVKEDSVPPFNPTRTKLLQQFRLDTPLIRGDAHYLYDANGVRYLDFLSQYGAVSFGQNPDELWKTLYDCGKEKIASMVQPFLPVDATRLAARLAEITPGNLKFSIFTNSGAEAVEAAIKLARARSGNLTILSTENGFHGKTLGALSATGKPKYQKAFGAPAPHFEYVPFGDIEALETYLGNTADKVAAFIIEPIQGEGGVIAAPANYMASALALCRKYKVLSIVDEIQTGLGRTGKLFCLPDDADGPDIMVLGKALGGGLMPIGACIANEAAWDDEFGMLHSSTFANNNLACRIALAALDLLLSNDQKMVRHVASSGEYLLERLQELQNNYPNVIKQVRGQGYMVGVEFFPYAGSDSYLMTYCCMNGYLIAFISAYLFNEHHIITAPMFNNSYVLRLQPPFTVGQVEIDQMLEALDCLCDILQSKDYYQLIHHFIGDLNVRSEKKSYKEKHTSILKTVGKEYKKPKNKFAFIVHYTSEQDLINSDPSFEKFSKNELERWTKWIKSMGPGFIHHQNEICSPAGNKVEGWLIAVPILPKDMLTMGRVKVLSLLENAVKLAKEQGAQVLGLGGFTSIISRGGMDLTGQGIAVTSGNCLTTIMTIAGIEMVTQRMQIKLSDVDMAVVGATGAIGRLASLLLAGRVNSLSLIGNASSPDGLSRCRIIAGEIYQMLIQQAEKNITLADDMGRKVYDIIRSLKNIPIDQLSRSQAILVQNLHKSIQPNEVAQYETLTMAMEEVITDRGIKPPIHCSLNIDTTLVKADVIVVATNSDVALVKSKHLKSGAIVCDVARPLNVSSDVITGREDVLIFEGGLVALPQKVYFGSMQGLPAGITLGCLSETILLGLEGERCDHSIGQRLELQEAVYMKRLAKKHHFKCAAPHCQGKLLSRADFERVKLLSKANTGYSEKKNLAFQ